MYGDENLFEHLSLGRAFNRTFKIFVNRLDIFMTLSAFVLFPTLIFTTTAVLVFVQANYGPIGGLYGKSVTAFLAHHHKGVVVATLIEAFIYATITILGEAAIIIVTSCRPPRQAQPTFITEVALELMLLRNKFWRAVGTTCSDTKWLALVTLTTMATTMLS